MHNLLKPFIEIDLETLATTQDAAIIQLAAVYREPAKALEGDESVETCDFYIKPDMEKFNADADTLAFHIAASNRRDKLQYSLESAGEEYLDLFRLHKFIIGHEPELVFCRGTDFDFPILEHHYKTYGIPMPEQLRCYKRRDERTLIDAATLTGFTPPERDNAEYPPLDALGDACWQAELHVQAVQYLHEVAGTALRIRRPTLGGLGQRRGGKDKYGRG